MFMVLGDAALAAHMHERFRLVLDAELMLKLTAAIALQTMDAPCDWINLYETHLLLLERCCW